LEGRIVLSASYTIADIGKLLGATFSEAFSVNAGGEMVGTWMKAGGSTLHAYLFGKGKTTDLGSFGAYGAVLTGINDANVAVGTLETSSLTNPEPTFRYASGTMTQVDGITVTQGHVVINNLNEVLGYSNATNDATLSIGGTLVDLGSIAGDGSVGMGISNAGHVVGYSNTGTTVSTAGTAPFGPANSAPTAVAHPFLYQRGKMTGLATLGGTDAIATAINSAGVVVGYSQTKGDLATHPFSYVNGKMSDLGAPKGSNDAWATAINASGVVVGDFRVSPTSSTQHAFVDIKGTMTDLNSLIPKNSGYTLIDATSINNNGQIVVNAVNKSGQETSLLLTPPATPPKPLIHPQPKPHSRHHHHHHRH
jgi:probable HAF family extracellular repeat protein